MLGSETLTTVQGTEGAGHMVTCFFLSRIFKSFWRERERERERETDRERERERERERAQRAFGAKMTSDQRRCDVITSHQR